MADLTDQQTALTVKLTGSDSTGTENNFITVKAASTAAAAADTSMVVSVHPSSTAPVQGIIATNGSLGTTKPVLVGGSQSGAMQPIAVDVNGYVKVLSSAILATDAAQFGATLTTSGSFDEQSVSGRECQITVNVKGAVTGTTPSITFFAQDVDGGDQSTLIAGTQTVGPTFTAVGTGSFVHYSKSGIVRVSWVVTGTTPSFANTYVYITQKAQSAPALDDRITATTALGALNAAVSIPLWGMPGAAWQIAAGTLIGTLVAELSFDGGTNWYSTYFDDPTTGNKTSTIVFASSNTLTARTIVGAGGASHARVRVSAYTSGTAGSVMRSSFVNDPSLLYAGSANSTVQPPMVSQVGGWDGTNLRSAGVTAKGTQGPFAVATQDLKDAGRVMKCFSATFTAAATEALVTLTPVADGVAGTTGTSFTVTSGKKLRLVSLSVSTRNAGAAIQSVVCNLRIATSAVTATSPLVASVGCGTQIATASAADFGSMPLDMELSGTMQLGISQIGTATAGNTVTLVGYEY
jgi:hypothetical protein